MYTRIGIDSYVNGVSVILVITKVRGRDVSLTDEVLDTNTLYLVRAKESELTFRIRRDTHFIRSTIMGGVI